MTDDRNDTIATRDQRDLASRVISVLRDRQSTTSDGARRFILDHLMRSICSGGSFDAQVALDILRGHRVPLDRVIDVYIPQAAERLGEMWSDDEIGFATVTVATMRLQGLLAEVSAEIFYQPNATHIYRALIVVPKSEQHFLGASVVAAQLRRRGCETQLSFAEEHRVLLRRAQVEHADMILFTCSQVAGLESIGQSVLGIRNALAKPPVLAVGGTVRAKPEVVQEVTGADLVTTDVKDVIAFCAKRRRAMTVE
ncbi:MAG: cobalamin-dependent protein [Pseudomonadota bacterium]